jgi:hypothetical protein
MNQVTEKDSAKLRKLQNSYNLIPNFIWSVLSLTPISVFCYKYIELKLLYVFLAISALPIFFPNSFFDKIQLGKTTTIYKKLGVPIINKIAQNGDIINRHIRRQFPDFKVVTFQKPSTNRLLQQTYLYEKFHFVLFIFFILATVYALSKKYFGWALILTLTNLVYNIYPNLLQQYIRIKLMLFTRKSI